MPELSFLNAKKPWICPLILEEDPEGYKRKIRMALEEGADALGLQMEKLKREYRTEENLRDIFAACGDRPVYVTSYRNGNSEGLTDEQCAEYLLLCLRCGATLCDIMGDYFHPETCQMTFDPEAVAKQKALAARIHAEGGEVLFSAHLQRFFPEEDILRFANAQAERGADIVKLVSGADNDEQLIADLRIIRRLKKELDRPFIFLANGDECRLIRQIGADLGVCLYFARMGETGVQPTIKTIAFLRDELKTL